MSKSQFWNRPYIHWIISFVLALGTTLRSWFLLKYHPPQDYIFSDSANYVNDAKEMVTGVFRSSQTFQSILYPYALAISADITNGSLFSIDALHVIAGMATVFFTWRAASHLLDEKQALVVLFLMTFHAPQIFLSGFYFAETFFTATVSVLFYFLCKTVFPWKPKQALSIGMITAFGLIIKGNNTLFIPLLIVWSLSWGYLNTKKIVSTLFFFLLGISVILIPTGFFTQQQNGKFQMLPLSGALNFIEGKCPSKDNESPSGRWLSPLFEQLDEREHKVWDRSFEDQGFYLKEGLKCIIDNPVVLVTSLRYVYFLFFGNELWPINASKLATINRSYERLFHLFLWPGILIGLLIIFKRPFDPKIIPFLMILSLFMSAWLLKSELRYRIPFDGLFVTLAVMGWSFIYGNLAFKNERIVKQ